MKMLRVNEPKDPVLRSISRIIPDRWLDALWPAKGKTRWKEWRTSQWVRLHLLVLLKGQGSFNATCRELRYHSDWRRFCRIHPDCKAPSPGTLSKFRSAFGVEGWRKFHLYLLSDLLADLQGREIGIYVLDSTDLPAAVRSTFKKKTTYPSLCGPSQ